MSEIEISRQSDGGHNLIITSLNGSRFRLKADNDGNLSTEAE